MNTNPFNTHAYALNLGIGQIMPNPHQQHSFAFIHATSSGAIYSSSNQNPIFPIPLASSNSAQPYHVTYMQVLPSTNSLQSIRMHGHQGNPIPISTPIPERTFQVFNDCIERSSISTTTLPFLSRGTLCPNSQMQQTVFNEPQIVNPQVMPFSSISNAPVEQINSASFTFQPSACLPNSTCMLRSLFFYVHFRDICTLI